MSLHHSFSVEHAEKYGIEEAILIHHFQFWIEQNQSLARNFHDGHTWMYQTQKEISAIYPYMSEFVVQRVIKSLLDKEVIITGNYNKTSFDKTLWYAFKDEEKFTKLRNRRIDKTESCKENTKGLKKSLRSCEIAESESAKSQNGRCEIAEPIPNSKQIAKTSDDDDARMRADDDSLKEKVDKKNLSKDDIHFACVKKRKNWLPDEIDKAWQSYVKYSANVENPIEYIEAIIEKSRVLIKKPKGKPCQKSSQFQEMKLETTPKKRVSLEQLYSESATAIARLEALSRQGNLK